MSHKKTRDRPYRPHEPNSIIECRVAGNVRPSPVDGVFESDSLVSEEVRGELQRGVRLLEDVPEELKDWHPGSDGQVACLHESNLSLGLTLRMYTCTVALSVVLDGVMRSKDLKNCSSLPDSSPESPRL